MGVGILCFQQTLVVRLGAFGEADEAVALAHLEADAVTLVLVTTHLAVGFLVAVCGLGILFAPESQIGILGGVSSLRIDVGAHENKQRRQDD